MAWFEVIRTVKYTESLAVEAETAEEAKALSEGMPAENNNDDAVIDVRARARSFGVLKGLPGAEGK
ncbi:MAG: hypothetical protein ACKO0Z_16670 [Betaproteobacteria bacterium]